MHRETISDELLAVAVELCSIHELNPFRIVDGAAVALHIGHRRSIDIDFFCNKN